MAGDWLRLYRKSEDSRVFSDDWLWRLWCWCMMRANWKTTWKDGREILPGQFTMGRIEAADRLKVSPSKLYRGLHTLRDWGQIRLEANSRFTVVTVCNWKTYQPENSEEWTAGEQPVNSQRTAGEQPADTLVRREEGKKGRHLFSPDEPASKNGPSPPKDKKPRERDLLFDAIAEITCSDPKSSGSHVGKVAAALRKAEPPYTPDEVRALPAALQRGGLNVPVTLGVVEKYIGWVRIKTVGETTADRIVRANRELEERRRRDAERADPPEVIKAKLRKVIPDREGAS